jgi:hypothetical protein
MLVNCRRTLLAKDEPQRTGDSREVTRPGFKKVHVKIESGTQFASLGSDMAHCNAAGVDGSNSIKKGA